MNAEGMITDTVIHLSRGYWYEHGAPGVQKDLKKAFEEYSESAAKGNAKAQFALGYMYDKGRYVRPDTAKAFEWYLKAAEGGYHIAQCYCGDMYLTGEGVEQNLQEAFEWLSKANGQGDIGARFSLANIYEQGVPGVQKDLPEAFEMYLSADAENYGRAQTYLKHVRDNGNAEAQFHLGIAYENRGRLEDAFELYLKSAKKGYVDAQFKLGQILDGSDWNFNPHLITHVSPNLLSEAGSSLEWYEKGAEQWDSRCIVALEMRL
ncbi:hypothetical protein FACS189472_01790 [Alphaproteobacteria bacterium]|nr:hypothetical protein FACS189472_01790 [Alphaproteobacteria bacterium]